MTRIHLGPQQQAIVNALSKRRMSINKLAKSISQYPSERIVQQAAKLVARGLVKMRGGDAYELTTEGRELVLLPAQTVPDLAKLHGHWTPPPVVRRPGSMDFLKHPSRYGDKRVYRQGTFLE